jgi:hypothetical protein
LTASFPPSLCARSSRSTLLACFSALYSYPTTA